MGSRTGLGFTAGFVESFALSALATTPLPAVEPAGREFAGGFALCAKAAALRKAENIKGIMAI